MWKARTSQQNVENFTEIASPFKLQYASHGQSIDWKLYLKNTWDPRKINIAMEIQIYMYKEGMMIFSGETIELDYWNMIIWNYSQSINAHALSVCKHRSQLTSTRFFIQKNNIHVARNKKLIEFILNENIFLGSSRQLVYMYLGGGTPYIQMIGMTVVFFRGWNRRFGIF